MPILRRSRNGNQPPLSSFPDYYTVLDVADHATLQEIEAAYYRKVYEANPVERDMLNRAYELLSDDDRRRWYDAERDAAGR